MRLPCSLLLTASAGAIISLITAACAPKHYIQEDKHSITLYYQHDSAKEVLFASSLDHYQLHPATRVKKNTWKVTVPRKTEFSYFYLVDKTPTLPDCKLTVPDDFGSKNCLFVAEM